MEIVFVWLVFSALVGFFAGQRGRSGLGWFLFSLILSPLLGLLFVAVLTDKKAAAGPSPKTHVRCPDCRELVLKDARKCKHCGCALLPQ